MGTIHGGKTEFLLDLMTELSELMRNCNRR